MDSHQWRKVGRVMLCRNLSYKDQSIAPTAEVAKVMTEARIVKLFV